MAKNKIKNIIIENARIIFRNFAGKTDRWNPNGQQNFGVIIDNDSAEDLAEEGWNIKWLKPRDEEDDPRGQAYLKVRVNYAAIPPHVYMCTKRKKTILTEETVKILDNAEIENVDLEISPYYWNIPGKSGDDSGITAYLKTGYFTIIEDVFSEKYSKYDEPETMKAPNDSEDDEIPFN